MFTRQHYAKIATAFRTVAEERGQLYSEEQGIFDEIVDNLVSVFEKDNPHFNREVFLFAARGV